MTTTLQELMKENCWIVQLKPFDSDEENRLSKIAAFQEECYHENFIAMGWPLKKKKTNITHGSKLKDSNFPHE